MKKKKMREKKKRRRIGRAKENALTQSVYE